jgi:hypothetical protein
METILIISTFIPSAARITEINKIGVANEILGLPKLSITINNPIKTIIKDIRPYIGG